ncbi:hypothetical protein FACS1894161_4350 [Spirochaetia bacterium]|nr:hypothetical protein FACS1894161_4350 [Spirochaetia bacterium]
MKTDYDPLLEAAKEAQDAPQGAMVAQDEAPPVLSTLDNPRPRLEGFNSFGIITAEPIKTIEENHKKNFVKIFIYHCAGVYYYGYQLRVDKIIRAKKASIYDPPLEAADAARLAAREEIRGICGSSRFIRDVFDDFTTIIYNQPELF